jgi:hypothetical protein
MKATKAYIASLGTTGVLLAASILMLAVVSAVVAFDRWPGASASAPIQTLVLNDQPAAIRVGAGATGASLTAVGRGATRGAAGTGAGGAVHRTGAGGVAGQRFSGGTRTPVGTTAPAAAALPGVPKTPSVPNPDTILDPISNPSTAASQVADGAQTAVDTAGVSVGKISPELGSTVTTVGDGAAQTIRDLPLPGHIVPGH